MSVAAAGLCPPASALVEATEMSRTVRARAKRAIVIVPVLAAGVAVGGGCATKTQTGLLVGGAGGAGVGAAIGSASGNAGKGALIGGAIGLLGGGLIGHAADKSDEADAERKRREEAERRAAEDRRAAERAAADRAAAERAYARNQYASAAPTPPPPAAYEAPAAGRNRPTREQIVRWTQAGTRDEIIVDRIERSDAVFLLTATEERDLRSQGVSETVIFAMRETARR